MQQRVTAIKANCFISIATLFLSAVLISPLALASSETTTQQQAPQTLQAQREWRQERVDYQLARRALQAGKYDDYLRLRNQLTHYPLYPYLEFDYLKQRLDKLQVTDIQHFVNSYRDTPLAAALRHQWLRHLAKTAQWQQYQQEFDNQIESSELRCYALWAKHKAGRTKEALAEVSSLWLVGYSQVNACNLIFDLWVKSGYLSDEMAWQRFQLAMQANNLSLADYLIRFMSPKHQGLAKLTRDIYLNPQRLQDRSRFEPFNKNHRDIIFEGFKRLARQNSLLAWQLWPDYQQTQSFNPVEISTIYQLNTQWLAHQDNNSAYYEALKRHPEQINSDTLEAGIRMAIRAQDWSNIIALTKRLPPTEQESTRSQYWLLRAQVATGAATLEQLRPQLETLALQRDYYSFLAADQLQQPYKMNHESYTLDANFLELFKVKPAVIRARELLVAGQTTEARREWFRTSQDFNADQHYAAAHYARQMQWHGQAILSAIAAQRWHDLELRFPLAHEEAIQKAAQLRQINSNWLMAMARQESAMMPDAVSGKNARGLVQILPSTAREIARKYNISYHDQAELFIPNKNIELASAYLSNLLKEFNGNDIYATAAYNAGAYRVKKWLESTSHLPIDVWIESIPFYETRQYVKNVLTYSAVYAYRRNQTGVQMATINYQ